jgi:lipopolysaccharide transport system permease protein
MKSDSKSEEWEWELTSETSWWDWKLKEVWAYRNLWLRLIRKDFLLNHQQTLLGPLWILFQPILTLFTYVLVFNKLVGISTGNIPPVLFYLIGIALWTFFSESFIAISFTFTHYESIFQKVYFPRLIVPLSLVSANVIRLLLQLFLLFILILVYWSLYNTPITISWWLLLLPFAIAVIGINGLSAGLLFAVLTAQYRDLINIVNIGIRLMMFITPVIYPVTIVPDNLKLLMELNPLSPLFELSRFCIFNEGTFTAGQLLYSVSITLLLFVGSMMLFHKRVDKLMDVV